MVQGKGGKRGAAPIRTKVAGRKPRRSKLAAELAAAQARVAALERQRVEALARIDEAIASLRALLQDDR